MDLEAVLVQTRILALVYRRRQAPTLNSTEFNGIRSPTRLEAMIAISHLFHMRKGSLAHSLGHSTDFIRQGMGHCGTSAIDIVRSEAVFQIRPSIHPPQPAAQPAASSCVTLLSSI